MCVRTCSSVLLHLGRYFGLSILAQPSLTTTHNSHGLDEDVPRFSKEIVQELGVGRVTKFSWRPGRQAVECCC